VPHREKVPETCPHCGRDLSPWEQVLLSVDRALMCKGCWYRIIIDAFDSHQFNPNRDNTEAEGKSG
jgi:DNA-directed RNA polymerase subunit RPC12/RpoP